MDQNLGNCPICEKPFKNGDDVVICPYCGAPYHRECYTKEGHCLFEDKHAGGFEYQTPAAQQSAAGDSGAENAAPPPPPGAQYAQGHNSGGILCQNCKTANDKSNIFCEKCGYPLHGAQAQNTGRDGSAPPPPGYGGSTPFGAGGPAGPGGGPGYGQAMGFDYSGEIEGIPKREWAEFIGNAAPAYLYRMSQMQQRGRKIGVLLSAFFLTEFYFAYRKMWGWAALNFGIELISMLLQTLWVVSDLGIALLLPIPTNVLYVAYSVSTYIYWVAKIVFGLFALYLYQRDGAKKITTLKAQLGGDAAYHEALRKKGGVSILGVVALVALTLVFVYVAIPAIIGQEGLMALYQIAIEAMPALGQAM